MNMIHDKPNNVSAVIVTAFYRLRCENNTFRKRQRQLNIAIIAGIARLECPIQNKSTPGLSWIQTRG